MFEFRALDVALLRDTVIGLPRPTGEFEITADHYQPDRDQAAHHGHSATALAFFEVVVSRTLEPLDGTSMRRIDGFDASEYSERCVLLADSQVTISNPEQCVHSGLGIAKLDDLELRLHTLSLNVSGELALVEIPHFGLLLQTSPTALEGWNALFPLLSAYQPKGSFFLRSSVRGTPDDASVNLQVSSDKFAFQLPPPEGPKGDGADRAGLLESCNLKVQAKRKAEELHGIAQAEIKKGRA